jgi:hypothetical protein
MNRRLQGLTIVQQTLSSDRRARVVIAMRSDGLFTYFEELQRSESPLPDFVTEGNTEGTFVLRSGGIFASFEDAEATAVQHIPWMKSS